MEHVRIGSCDLVEIDRFIYGPHVLVDPRMSGLLFWSVSGMCVTLLCCLLVVDSDLVDLCWYLVPYCTRIGVIKELK